MANVMQPHPVIEALFCQTGTKASCREVGTGKRSEGREGDGWRKFTVKENVWRDKGVMRVTEERGKTKKRGRNDE